MNWRSNLAIYVLIGRIHLKPKYVNQICQHRNAARVLWGPGCGSNGLAAGERGTLPQEELECSRGAYTCCSVENGAGGPELGGSTVGEEPLDHCLVFDYTSIMQKVGRSVGRGLNSKIAVHGKGKFNRTLEA